MFMLHCSHSQVSKEIADGLVPIWRQGISNNYDVVGRSVYIMGAPA